MNVAYDETPQGALLMESDPIAYERYLLAALNKNEKIWNVMHPVICLSQDKRTFINDFSTRELYVLYRALLGWRTIILKGGGSFCEVDVNGIATQLKIFTVSANDLLVTDEEIPALKEMWNDIMSASTKEEALGVVGDTYRPWMYNRRFKQMLRGISLAGAAEITDRVREFSEAQEQLSALNEDEDGFVEFGDGIDGLQRQLERVKLGQNFRHLSECLGGGLGKTEHIMFFAPTGAGKTVLACQLAADVASSGKHALLITTEQPAFELMPRIISALSPKGEGSIMFDKIKDGGDYSKLLTEAQYDAYLKITNALRGHLRFYEWAGKGLTVKDNLESIIKSHLKKAPLDVVILDWIGGGLAHDFTGDNIRHAYNEAADTMCDIAIKYNLATVSMAQASADAVGKQHVTEKYIAESKLMHKRAVAAFGISALRADNATGDDKAAYASQQWCYCFKSRKAMGRAFSMQRDFSRQRYLGM